MCGFSPSEFVIVMLLVAVLAGPRLLPFLRRAGALRPPRRQAEPRPEPLRIVIALAATLLVAFFVLRFGSRLMPLVARLVRGSTW